MGDARMIDVPDIINTHSISRFQAMLIVLCFLVMVIDGFDTAAVGFIAPALRAQWNLTPAQLAPLFGAGLFGLMVGAFIFGPLADKVGRRPALLATTLFFGTATVASAFASSIETLTALRFVTGLGLGGAMPAAIALTSEFCPESRRSFLVTVMFCGFAVGSAVSGVAASQIMAIYGWPGVLMVGGILPIALAGVLWALLPESIRFLTMKGTDPGRITAMLRRIAPEVDYANAVFTGVRKSAGSSVSQLFSASLAMGTVLIWISFFMSLLVFYLLSSWLPILITTAGFSISRASLMAATLASGGTLGAIVIGTLMDRFNPHWVLASFYGLGGISVMALGAATAFPWLLVIAIFLAGFGAAGAQFGLNALAAGYYNTASRATGVSWANAVGRIGSVVGSMIGGLLLSFGLNLETIFIAAALPAFVAGIAMLIKGKSEAPMHSMVTVTEAK